MNRIDKGILLIVIGMAPFGAGIIPKLLGGGLDYRLIIMGLPLICLGIYAIFTKRKEMSKAKG